MYEYRAIVTRVVDGDTVRAELDLGCDVAIRLTLRLAGINCPEMGTEAGIEARQFVIDWLEAVDYEVVVHTLKDRREKYGRYLAEVFAGDVSLNQALLDAGHAVDA